MSSTASPYSRSIARHATLLVLALVAAVMLAMSAAITYLTGQTTRAQVVDSLRGVTASVAASLDAVDAANRTTVERGARLFQQHFDPDMRLDAATGELSNGGRVLNQHYDIVDAFTHDTGNVATIFARQGDDFVRIATSLLNDKGERAQGTRLDRQHPAYPLMLAGTPYAGRARLFGKPYMTHYQPIKSADGRVIAILFVGIDMTAFDDNMQQQIAQMRFYEHGGVTVIAPGATPGDAVFVAHPTERGRRVLDASPSAESYLQAIASGLGTGTIDAAGSPLLPQQGGQAWAIATPTRTGWWVVGEVSDTEAMAGSRRMLTGIWAIMAAAVLLLGVAIFLLIRRSVSRPLQELAAAVTTVAQGDLTHPLETRRRDEIGALMHEIEHMRRRYLQVLQQVHAAVDNVTAASTEIAAGNQDLSTRTEGAASLLSQTAQRIGHFAATTRHAADSTRQADRLAAAAAEMAGRGGRVVGDLVTTMDAINGRSHQIAGIIGVIETIAFQTNILALNAAVEAARAGEQGKGFAVVAGEVRGLASRSAEAAREIKQLILASVEKVDAGTALVRQSGQAMQDIVGSVQQVGQIIGEIAASAAEQSDSIGQVDDAIGQLDQMTQQNAALVEQSSAAASSLRDQAGGLGRALQVFRLEPATDLSPAPY